MAFRHVFLNSRLMFPLLNIKYWISRMIQVGNLKSMWIKMEIRSYSHLPPSLLPCKLPSVPVSRLLFSNFCHRLSLLSEELPGSGTRKTHENEDMNTNFLVVVQIIHVRIGVREKLGKCCIRRPLATHQIAQHSRIHGSLRICHVNQEGIICGWVWCHLSAHTRADFFSWESCAVFFHLVGNSLGCRTSSRL